ncbi:hypothetical protein COEREDRAFT_87740 [Coemansia reversa NRRL 1564]|uniref:Uncharacterized protein n=1 Tax=Coemansia reversa (strain ATCC 12441 / NRRL 1564) TaxID=763665 RepID=A0A2G5B973_COERN|nr:hypothetical protein COEREDRAFT_87740 [Coemansia reversa NRRL 1564]|eukprot:PIA15554.1 hypothetical protein COEREDRAFT_87740 [Coemansia reversa NRRL 1564]
MVFETSQHMSQIRSQGYIELDHQSAIVITETNVRSESQNEKDDNKTVCLECLASPPRNVMSCPDTKCHRWLIECMGNVVVITDTKKILWAAEFAREVRCVWWIDNNSIGVVSVADQIQQGILTLFVIDVSTIDNKQQQSVIQLALSANTNARVPLHVIAYNHHIVCAIPGESSDTSILWHWRINNTQQNDSTVILRGVQVVESVQLGSEYSTVLGLRWIKGDIGIAATQTSVFWFTTGLYQRVVDVACNLQRLDMLSWRWDESIVAVDTKSISNQCPVPPERPVLCLPGPTGMSFYELGVKGHPVPLRIRQTFPRGWVWLCASTTAYAILSPCRRMATVCRMPTGEKLYTVRIHPSNIDDIIQDGWLLGDSSACALSTGEMLYIVSPLSLNG